LPAGRPPSPLVAGEAPDPSIRWIEPALVAEVSFTAWSGEGRVRRAVFLGLREDTAPRDVIMAARDPETPRRTIKPLAPTSKRQSRSRRNGAVPPLRRVDIDRT
jgi:bifunctional non-homologous end joining protein LigD